MIIISKENQFKNVSSNLGNPNWKKFIQRESELYNRDKDARSHFYRDYSRILHCNGYRRLKHKTQVFFATRNDHICTRIEHVNHVASVSYTIANNFGLNVELTNAIANGHDLGHAPFGHQGERILNKIAMDNIGDSFWHEGNSLWFVDNIETLPDPLGRFQNLNLTYAVRDGIVLHCGEVDDEKVYPRETFFDLTEIKNAAQYQSCTWEGCVVKISDKIAYLGRDIEDAISNKLLTISDIKALKKILKKEINTTVIMYDFICNLCENSSPDKGLSFSNDFVELINEIKEFNINKIYKHDRFKNFNNYVELIIKAIYETLENLYSEMNTLENLGRLQPIYPYLVESFTDWIIKFTDTDKKRRKKNKYFNKVVYNIEEITDYKRMIIHYISGMTDHFAMEVFAELTSF